MKLTNAKLDQIIADYKTNPSVDTMLAAFDALELLATNIVKVMLAGKKNDTFKEVFKNKKKVIRELVCFAFLKIDRYDPAKGKAFNFFTTIMLGWLRQVYRTKRNYAELKEKYKKYAEENRDTATSGQKVYRRRERSV
jgi:hypothetical protein